MQITKVQMELALDPLNIIHKASFTFPKETQFLGAVPVDKSQLTLFYMAPEKNFKKTGDCQGYDFIAVNLNCYSIKIPDEFEFLTMFSWETTTYGVFFRKS